MNTTLTTYGTDAMVQFNLNRRLNVLSPAKTIYARESAA